MLVTINVPFRALLNIFSIINIYFLPTICYEICWSHLFLSSGNSV